MVDVGDDGDVAQVHGGVKNQARATRARFNPQYNY
jgi:hypothetical protein